MNVSEEMAKRAPWPVLLRGALAVGALGAALVFFLG